MPWKEVNKVELRRVFIAAVTSGKSNFAEVCCQFDISRKTGYKWLHRYLCEGARGLEDRSRRPHMIYYATDPEVERRLLEERKAHEAWGARKLCQRLKNAGVAPPPERTANRNLKRAGLVKKREPRPEEELNRFEYPNPNDLWQIDHKRAIHGRWARRTVPFVVLDDNTRYLLGLRGLSDKGLVSTWGVMWDVFGEFGLPCGILSDNDQIFHGNNGPSQFEARLMRLGIDVLHGRFYHPQTQGKVERFNGTLERELLRNGCFTSGEELQAAFDSFRYEYNFERPHEAIDMDVPGERYRPSATPRPDKLPEMEYPDGAVLRKVQKDGWISWKGYCIEVGRGIYGERVEVREVDYGIEVYYGRYRIQGRRLDGSTRTTNDKLGRTRSQKGGSGNSASG